MAFGYGVGDVIATGKLAWTVYKACKDAPASFGTVAQEVIALEAVVRQFEEAFEGQALSTTEQDRLKAVCQGCQDVLNELQDLVQKYKRLGSNAKLSFDRFKWAAVPVGELRTRLISNTSLLSAFIQTSPVVITKHVRKIVQEYQDGKHEGSIFSSLSADSLTSDKRTQWRVIRKELESSGLTLSVLDNNRELIVDCLIRALGPVADQDRDTAPTDEGKGKERLVESPPSASQYLTANPFTDSAFEVSIERQELARAKETVDVEVVGHSTAEELKPVASTARKINEVVLRTQSSPTHKRYFLQTALRIFSWGFDRESQEAVIRSREIDQAIKAEKASRFSAKQFLLLGACEAGKTTLLKQMVRLFMGPYSIDQRKEFRKVIFSNIIVVCRILIEEMKDRKISFAAEESKVAAQILEKRQDMGLDDPFPPKYCAAIETLKMDKGFQSTFQLGHQFALHNNASYYLNHLQRIAQKYYIPSSQDIMRSSLYTFNVTETLLVDKDRKTNFTVFEDGGWDSSRKQHVYAAGGVDLLIFVAPISVYHRCLLEDKKRNAMREALMRFASVMKRPWFKNNRVILLLNKADQLEDVLSQHQIQDYFPDYSGDPQSESDVIQYFTTKFLAINVKKERRIVVRVIDLMDTKGVHQFLRDEVFYPADSAAA